MKVYFLMYRKNEIGRYIRYFFQFNVKENQLRIKRRQLDKVQVLATYFFISKKESVFLYHM